MPNGDGVTSMIRSEKAVTSISLADSLYCLPTLQAFVMQAAKWERPLWQETAGGLRTTAGEELGAGSNHR